MAIHKVKGVLSLKDNLFLQEVQVNKSNLTELFNYLNQDFRTMERLPLYVIRSAFYKGVLGATYLTDGDNVYGYAIYQTVPSYNWLHVLYIAVLSEHRSSGLGSTFINQLNNFNNQGIILEVEAPEAGNNEEDTTTRERRVKFYERNGFYLNPNMKLINFGYPIRLMSNVQLPDIDWLKFYRKLYNCVYGFPPLASLFIKKQSS